ncbi:bifunctional O-antigen ligase/aminoglycoside phosphotransferase family protein [Pseudomonas xantholysinigenes]|uniref:O-antigen ligase family protein n=1 Tax=Pseudomonas xantholysinigenes TaxID=2745490 RepID=A0A9E6TW79_9PSED|nr:bifunctional O-antigen ligase/aminoglycoside phosphotransferase family protein [Pseudomonas xantholysinigenes]QXI38063.1 O-antigen ligase family protein [Pseudomonas xantholysinigenes]
MHLSCVKTGANRLFDTISLWLLPAGLFFLLSALFLFPERSLQHKLYYALFSIPTLLALCVRPGELKPLLREPLVLLFVLFAAIALISLGWSGTEDSASSLAKRPLHIFMLFAGMTLLVRHRLEALQPVLLASALVALFGTLPALIEFFQHPPIDQRLIGGGALDNPLLSSHLFGFFSIYWLVLCMTCRDLRILALSGCALAVMCGLILTTGSRTPLLAMTLAAIWLACLRRDGRAKLLLAGLVVAAVATVLLFGQMILERGSSFRFEIWRMVLELISQRPLLGHGYDTSLALDPGTGYTLSEPHNFALGVLYDVGLVGLLPWLGLLGYGLYSGWRHRAQPLFVLASTLLMYGIGAGLTEGGGIMSRPKEHWFLLWIPLALIAALNIARRTGYLPRQVMQALAPEPARQLMADAQVIEEDGLGPKVLRLADGSFLKLFRRRRWFTSGSFNPYATRFANNSQQLVTLGFVAPRILGLYRFTDGSSAVHYQPLPGQTLRQALEQAPSAQARQTLTLAFGRYLARLHEHGVYFRSLHLGNVLVNQGELALIDVADMRILPSSLSLELRQRNLRHMQRYQEDRGWLFEENAAQLLTGYAEQASARAVARLERHIQVAKA